MDIDDAPPLLPHLNSLTSSIDNLEEALQPLLSQPLHTTTSTLPLLDKAKLHIMLSYAIESLLYSSVLTSGADAKSHAIFAELARLKTYFKKLQDAEQGPEQPKQKLDVGAAGRFIKAGLSGNDRFDRERAEKVAKEKARAALLAAKLKAKQHTKFDDEVETRRQNVEEAIALQRPVEDDLDDSEEEKDIESENAEIYGEAAQKEKKEKKSRKKPTNEQGEEKTKAEIKAERREKKKKHRSKKEETILPERSAQSAPKSHSDAFQALLNKPLKEGKESKPGKSKKGKSKS